VNRAFAGCAMLVFLISGIANGRSKPKLEGPVSLPQLELESGRKLVYQEAFASQRDAETKRSFWSRFVDIVAGEGEFHALITPYSVVADSHNRVIVTDPGARGIHIFDFAGHKYKFISREKERDGLQLPQCVAVDSSDNIYVTDSEAGKIFVFDPNGKFQRMIGNIRGGEGYFKRPTGIAIDTQAQHIYVTDTLRNQIFMLDMQGNVLNRFGKTGTAQGEFNFPTELRLSGDDLLVVDAMNFRVQALSRSGEFRYSIGRIGENPGSMFRPKGIGVDSEGHIYVVDGASSLVQVFDRAGQLLYYFGQKGTGFGEFQLPTGLFIDRNDRVLVVDSYNRRVQIFQYFALGKQAQGVQH
jgi:DNA-binding beta-propeller fold protein YncE